MVEDISWTSQTASKNILSYRAPYRAPFSFVVSACVPGEDETENGKRERERQIQVERERERREREREREREKEMLMGRLASNGG